MKIAVLGAGHVGLVSAGCLATIGHDVGVFDVDDQRIEQLQRGIIPFEEPHLDDLFITARAHQRLTFSSEADDVIGDAALVFLCVNTPSLREGDTDLSSVLTAARIVGDHAPRYAVVVNRSTAPVGTVDRIQSLLDPLPVVANPEFLAEGSAIADFLVPDRIVVGTLDASAAGCLLEAYDAIIRRDLPPVPAPVRQRLRSAAAPAPVIVTSPETAELAKYAANAHLCVRVSFMNEIASIADAVGADVSVVAQAVGLDHRIGPHFLQPGIGWGGSCLPKDIAALEQIASSRGVPARMVRAANRVNQDQRGWVAKKLSEFYPSLHRRRIGLLGLAYKPHTDDMRDAPAQEIVSQLVGLGAEVVAFDPAVREVGGLGPIASAEDPIALAEGADALVVVTEWPQFSDLDLERLRSVMRTPILLDGRNQLDPGRAQAAGFIYVGVGRRPPPARERPAPDAASPEERRNTEALGEVQGPPNKPRSWIDWPGPGRRRSQAPDRTRARRSTRGRR